MTVPRLHRLPEVFTKRPVYFVTFCTAERKMILHRPSLHSAFEVFRHHATGHGTYVGRYVIMPDHIHLFTATTGDSTSLSGWIKSLKNSLSKSLRAEAEPGPHWQKGFFDHLLRSGESYEQKWAYVAENPVRAGLVESADAWPYQGIVCDLGTSRLRRS